MVVTSGGQGLPTCATLEANLEIDEGGVVLTTYADEPAFCCGEILMRDRGGRAVTGGKGKTGGRRMGGVWRVRMRGGGRVWGGKRGTEAETGHGFMCWGDLIEAVR